MPGLDGKELTTALKIAKKKPRNFLFAAGSKVEDHYLELSKKRIPKSKAKEAKAAAGAPKAYMGVVEFDKDTGELVFQTNANFADKQTKALRMLVKKRAGLKSIEPVLKLVEVIEERDFEDEDENQDNQNQDSDSNVNNQQDAEHDANAEDNDDQASADDAEGGLGVSQKQLAQASLAWEKTRGAIKKDVEKLQKEIIKTFKDAPNSKDLAKSVKQMDAIVKDFGDDLGDKIDKLVNATGEEAIRLQQSVQSEIKKQLNHVQKDPLFKQIDKNPFAPVAIQKTAEQSLKAIDKMFSN
ncbi:MAG: hypothetical protein AAGK04_02235 [Planctomycetota bacterium]